MQCGAPPTQKCTKKFTQCSLKTINAIKAQLNMPKNALKPCPKPLSHHPPYGKNDAR